jgi:O-antigen/teichoic acid export membrane protein
MRLPETLVAEPIGRSVFSSTARQAGRSCEAGSEAWLSALRQLVIVLAPMMLGIGLVSDLAVVGILGPRWVESAPVLALLMPAGLAQSLLRVSSNAILGFGRPDLRLWLALLSGLLAALGIVVGASFGVRGVASGLSVGLLASAVPHVVITTRLFRVTAGRVLEVTAPPIVAAAVMGVGIVLFRTLHTASFPMGGLVECMGVGALVYGIALAGANYARRLMWGRSGR